MHALLTLAALALGPPAGSTGSRSDLMLACARWSQVYNIKLGKRMSSPTKLRVVLGAMEIGRGTLSEDAPVRS